MLSLENYDLVGMMEVDLNQSGYTKSWLAIVGPDLTVTTIDNLNKNCVNIHNLILTDGDMNCNIMSLLGPEYDL